MPSSNLFTHHLLFFSREATSETYNPRVFFLIYLPLRSTFSLAFIFRSIKPKIQKYFMRFISIYFICDLSIKLLQNYLTSVCLSSGAVPRKGLTTPLTRRVARICYLCAGVVYVGVAWFSYWFDNLGFFTEGNTYRHCAASSLPLWGNTNVASSDIKRNFWRRCRGGSSTYTRFLITNLISSQFTLFSICLSFSSPPLHKILPFYSPSFSFAVFSSDLSFACNHE